MIDGFAGRRSSQMSSSLTVKVHKAGDARFDSGNITRTGRRRRRRRTETTNERRTKRRWGRRGHQTGTGTKTSSSCCFVGTSSDIIEPERIPSGDLLHILFDRRPNRKPIVCNARVTFRRSPLPQQIWKGEHWRCSVCPL